MLKNDDSEQTYGHLKLVASSAGRGWQGIRVEVRGHGEGMIAKDATQPVTEVIIDPRGDKSVVITRKVYGELDRTVTQRGMVWLSPVGIQNDRVELSAELPGMLHIFLEPEQFAMSGLGESFAGTEFTALNFGKGTYDPLIAQTGLAILGELQSETAAGKLLVDTLACSLAAQLIHKYTNVAQARLSSLQQTAGIERNRVVWVKDFIETNLEQDISLDQLAAVACLSRFHFVRLFKTTTGQTPFQYLAERRMRRAMQLITERQRTMNDIAISLGFSSQAAFSRAFRRFAGCTPTEFDQTGSRKLLL